MPDDPHVRVPHLGGDPALLGARHQVVDQHPEPAVRRRPELGDDGGQVVDAVQRLDGDALDPQVVAPDPLDQLGVVDALDVDPARHGHPGLMPDDGQRSRGGRPAVPLAPVRAAALPACVTTPSSRKPAGSSGKTRRRPCRSSKVTVAPEMSLSSSTTAPQKPLGHPRPPGRARRRRTGTTPRRRQSPVSTSLL